MTSSSSIDISKKPISDFLQQLIDEANTSLDTAKTKIIRVYEQAKSEGFTPLEARKLVEEKIVNVSDRYIRESLPDEAKNLNMRRTAAVIAELVPQISEETTEGSSVDDDE